MKNLLVSLSGFGAFILGVVLSFDVTGVIGNGLLLEAAKPANTAKNTAPGAEAQSIRAYWENVGGYLNSALRKAHEEQ